MSLDTVLMLEWSGLVLGVLAIVAVWAVLFWRSWRTYRARRDHRPVRVTVLETRCIPREDYDFPFRVEIRFESGAGELDYAVSCGSEESARRFAARYAVGTTHEVIPGHDRGDVYLPEDYEPFHRGTPIAQTPMWGWAFAVIVVAFFAWYLAHVASEPR
jgi:hypothetical protein